MINKLKNHTSVTNNYISFLLTSALFVSTIGTAATTLGFFSYIYSKTNNPFDTGVVTMATLAVGIFLSPFLGILTKRKGVFFCMVIPEFISALLLIAIVYWDKIFIVYITAFLLGINSKLVGISRMSIVPTITEQKDLVRFNAVLRAANRAALIIGSLAYGMIINYSVFYVFYFDAFTYIVSSGLLLLLYMRHKSSYEVIYSDTKTHPIRMIIDQLVEGYKILYLDSSINFIVFLGMLSRFFYMSLPILLLVFIKNDLLLSDSEYGFLQAISRGVSFIVFILLAGFFKKIKWLTTKKVIFITFWIYGLSVWSIATLNNINSVYVVFSVAELSFFIAVVFVHAYMQQTVPSDKMPLASGSVGTGFSLASMASLVFFLFLAKSVNTRLLISTIGIGLIISVSVIYLCHYVIVKIYSSDQQKRKYAKTKASCSDLQS